MPLLHDVLAGGSALIGWAGAAYAATVSVTALASTFARSAARRREARATLAVLLRRSEER
ncbi:hypothetical protein [Kitasatospora sp. DSM 101779]|uniref:hypothetical protein n=1 Tax=Kitasatospora sp. DSM 101779 TaxID=2853165 RepID=UPI0021DA1D74|nr:hypothetical protein [Kitasatospora sp. DSM 101779]MCU7825719.1 hypothetical protein [Kitasatospora sp. DSM 101779]